MTRNLSELFMFVTASPELMLLIKSTIILTLGLSIVGLARSARASLRHLVLMCTFAAVAALPLATMLTPSYKLELTEQQPAQQTFQAVTGEMKSNTVAPVTSTSLTSTTPGKASFFGSTKTVLWMIWGAGTLLFIGTAAISLFKLRSLRRSGIPSLSAGSQLTELAAESGINRHIEVLLHDRVKVPFTFGFLRPAILLPTDTVKWSDGDIHRVLVHELEHIKRGDWLMQVFSRAVCSMYWFQPLAWVAWRQICLEAERASDDAVLSRTERTDYAEQLVLLAQRLSKTLAPPVLSMANRSDLSKRVRSILDNQQARGRAGIRWTVMALSLSALVLLAIAPGIAISRAQTQTQNASPGKKTNVTSRALDRALVEASEAGSNGEVEELLNAGANINSVVNGDGTPLIVAAREGNKALVEFLLARGADVNLSSPGDGNALIMAAREGHVEIVRILLDHNANIDLVVEGDENPLIQASSSGELEVVKLLIARGANVNARALSDRVNGEWRTPLGMARKSGHKEVVAVLIAAGARE